MQTIQASIKWLRESPFNHRRTFNQAKLIELAQSIEQIGILQPIVVRELPSEQQDIWVRYEIVAGHRRFRAAAIAGLEEVPVMITSMSEEQARIAQLTENVQREDVSPIEEANGYRALMDNHGMTVDDLKEKTGKSRSHIYNTLSLTKLGGAASDLVADGTIGREIGVLIARLPESLQQRGIDLVTIQVDDKTTALSYRQAKKALAERLYISIASAPFDTACNQLAKMVGACTVCPKLSQNDPGLAAELDPDVCTDPECYRGKTKAHLVNLSLAHKAAGGHVVAPEEESDILAHPAASWFIGHRDVNDQIDTPQGKVTIKEALQALKEEGASVPTTKLLIQEDAGKATELIRQDDYHELRRRLNPEPDETPTRPAPAAHQPPPWKSELHERCFQHRMDIKAACMKAALTSHRNGEELRWILCSQLDIMGDVPDMILDHFGWREQVEAQDLNTYDIGEWVAEHLVPSLTTEQCAAALVCVLLSDAPFGNPYGQDRDAHIERLLVMADNYGVEIPALQATQADDDANGDDDVDQEDATAEAVEGA